MKQLIAIAILTFIIMPVMAYDTYMTPELYRSYGKEQIKTKDSKGHIILQTPHYSSYEERNNIVSEKVVCIESRNAYDPYYGFLYTLYTPIGKYVGYGKRYQNSLNGYGYDGIPCGCEGDQTPKFKTIQDARRYYYPQWYK